MTECACGCGAEITRFDPSPDFKWIHCQQLWLCGVDKPDPQGWRAEQRFRTLLLRQDFTWQDSNWEFEWLDAHIAQYDPDFRGGIVSFEAGLAYLHEIYEYECLRRGVPNPLRQTALAGVSQPQV